MLAHDVITLANGLRVIHVPLPHLHTVGVCLAVGCGSRHDPAALPGLSHLLEHMLFRGSAQHPSLSGLAAAFEGQGASLDAGTWRDQMELTLQTMPTSLAAALATLADVVAHPTLDGLDEERAVVVEELRGELDPGGGDSCMGTRSRRAIWQDHPLGRPILGDEASLAAATVESLRAHHRRLFVAGNMTLCIAGPTTATDLAAALAPWEVVTAGSPAPQGPAPAPWPSDLEVADQPGAQVALQLSFAAPADLGSQLAPARLVCSVLDDGLTTRLQQEVVNRRGWAYDLQSGLDCYRDAGLFDVEVQCDPGRVADAAELIVRTLAGLADHGPRPDEMVAAHRRLAFAASCEIDDVAAISSRYASYALAGHPLGWDDESSLLTRVDAGQVRAQAQAMFVDGPMRITAVGPVPQAAVARLRELLAAARRSAA